MSLFSKEHSILKEFTRSRCFFNLVFFQNTKAHSFCFSFVEFDKCPNSVISSFWVREKKVEETLSSWNNPYETLKDKEEEEMKDEWKSFLIVL